MMSLAVSTWNGAFRSDLYSFTFMIQLQIIIEVTM